ncbi:MAG: hypothetical protein WAN46_00375 [Gammaproteobacteria bacterium]
MKTLSSTKHPKSLSTDVKFWFYLAPFLSASVIVWAYGVSWVLREAPTAIPRLVASWQTSVHSTGFSTRRSLEVPARLGDAGMPKEKRPLFEVGQEGGLPTAAGDKGI